MSKPRLLDLFCGAGGASMGYYRAGFDVVGVDLHPMPRYPFEFHQADAMTYPLDGFDVIHASPPCQQYSALNLMLKRSYPDLIAETRRRMAGHIYVIENVPGAPLMNAVRLCGSAFGLGASGRYLQRHRFFESNVMLLGLSCQHRGEAIGVYGNGGEWKRTGARRGGYQGTLPDRKVAMGVDWMNRHELSESIPPAYTEYIGRQLMAVLAVAS